MGWMIRRSVQRPVAVAMAYAAVALLAWAAWWNLPVDVVPSPDDFPSITVSTRWQGASPESLQALVTGPVESVATTIPGVAGVSSVSRRGVSEVTLEFERDADVELARLELSDRLTILREELPPDASAPALQQSLPSEFQELQGGTFLSLTLRAPRSLNALRRLAIERIQPALASVEGVSEVSVTGGQDPRLRVLLDPERMELHGLRASEVGQAVRQLDAAWPVGRLEMTGTAWSLRIDHAISDLEPLRRAPIREVDGQLIRLDDIGSVAYGYAEAREYSRVNGEPLVAVDVHRKPGTDVLTVARSARARLRSLQAELPGDLTFEVQRDEAAELEAELALLSRRLTLVLVLVGTLLILLLRDLRSAPLLFLSIGAALAITVVALYHLQVPVNVLTLTGLALAFGMLVDNAVVVLENVTRYRESGLSSPAAAVRGTSEVVVPVLAATLTTVGVFFPFVYFHGRLRDYFTPMAVAIALALSASLLVAVTLMPAAAGRGWVARRVERSAPRLPRFRRALELGLRHPWIVLLVVAAVGWGSWTLFDANVPRGDFFRGWGSRDRLTVRVTLQSGAVASRTEAAIRPFEEYVLDLPDVERVETRVVENSGFLTVTFAPEVERTAYPLVVKDQLIDIATRYAGVEIGVFGFDRNAYYSGFRSFSMSSRIKLFGYNYEELGRIGESIAAMAKRSARVREAQVTAGGRGAWRHEGSEIVLRLRRDRLAAHGVAVQQVVSQLATLLQGRTRRDRLRVGGEMWDLELKVDGVDRRTLEELLETPVRGATGSGTRLAELVEVEFQSVPGVITREDQRYDRYVQWEYRGSSRASENYRQAIFDSLELPPGYSASLDTWQRLTEDERLQIRRVALLAVAIVFMVLASLYESLLQPLVVLLSIPASLIGVFLIFYGTGRPFDASASVGVVLLGGIVVNNAILLVDHVNLRRRDRGLVEALVTGTAERVRPILITSVTTVGGMLPLVLIEATGEASRSGDIWASLALSTIGGLTASTVLTLTLTPILYLLAERARSRGRALSRRIGEIWRTLPA